MQKLVQADSDEALETDPRWQLVERTACSVVFSRATQLRAILLFLAKRSLTHAEEPVREYEIAIKVLGRRIDFNPLDDNIVRVQMGHLRKKLELFFSTEGHDEPIAITVPVGSYATVFTPRAARIPQSLPLDTLLVATARSVEAPHLATAPTRQEPALAHSTTTRRRLAILVALLLFGVFLAFLLLRFKDASNKLPQVANPIIRRIFASGAVVNTVIADTALVTIQNTVHTDITISDYLDRSYPDNILSSTADPSVRSTLRELATRRYTSLDDADVAAHSSRWGALMGATTYVRYARYMHVRDFEQGNFIIVGSRRGNPWTSLFEQKLNFVFEENRDHQFFFRNKQPGKGEASQYELGPDSGGGTVGYVDLAMMPNLTRTGTVLLLNGFNMEANEAAANLIFSKELPQQINSVFISKAADSTIEILLRVHTVDGAEKSYEIVSIRAD